MKIKDSSAAGDMTTDVLIVLPVADIKSKYVAYFHPNGRLEAA